MERENDFVCGFAFDESLRSVLLVRKKYPPRMYGKWNGVGGHYEPDRDVSYEAAMSREFQEETSFFVPPEAWTLFAVTQIGDSTCRWYRVQGLDEWKGTPQHSPTSEKVEWFSLGYLLEEKYKDCMADLRWLLPMAHAWHGGPPYDINRSEPE